MRADIATPWAPVLRWNADFVYIRCPFCEKVHTHGIGDDYSNSLRNPHCGTTSSRSYPLYRFRYPFSETNNTAAYEIEKSRGFYVAVEAKTAELDVESLEKAFSDFNLGRGPSSVSHWKNAKEMITIGLEDQAFKRLHDHFGGENTFVFKRLDHVVSRMLAYGDHGCVKNYLHTGAEVGMFLFGTDEEGNSALNLAACEKYADVVKLLLDHGVDVNHRNKAGRSPLMEAALWGRIDNVKYLLEHGANKDLRDSCGRWVAQFAEVSPSNDEERYNRLGREVQVYKENTFIANQARRVIVELLRRSEDDLIGETITQDDTSDAYSFNKTGRGSIRLVAPIAEFPIPHEWRTIATLQRQSKHPLIAAMSGWSHKESEITVAGRDWTDEVMRISEIVDHPLQVDERRDHGKPVSKHVLFGFGEQDILLRAKPSVQVTRATILDVGV
ncbi:hypothetical protein LTR53_009845 [Teratosphaeriaceae sp. CCFEE 6253]|nr:hypothetical protein LTR53_009845 [Teratosphaeriaceae sp. CCFEE 6253]